MYCINCGVKLADTEICCPLCETEVFHPDFRRTPVEPLYPGREVPAAQVPSRAAPIIVSTLFLMATMIVLVCNYQISGAITWAGYVAGGLMVAYVVFVLPYWFQKPNGVILVPCDFFAMGCYLLYINYAVGGHWFLPFAFPVTGYVGIVITTVVVLTKYLKKGLLYIWGGAIVALGLFMPLIEFQLYVTFAGIEFLGWCWYPMIALILLGAMLFVIGLHRPTRETMERKFFT